MIKYALRRLLLLLPVLFIVTILASSLIYMTPGDPVRVMLGLRADQASVDRIRSELELDKPMYVRYGKWLSRVVRGDLGRSLQRNEDVLDMILDRLPATLELAVFALALSVVLSLPIGVISATKSGTYIDKLLSFFSLFWVCMPGFWLALIALLVFSIHLDIFPISGRGGPIWTLKGLKYLILPGLVLGIRQIAIVTRLIRAGMLETLNADYVRTARSKGLSERVVIYSHALRNAMIPTVTIFGLQIPEIISMGVIIEIVFAWPGMGRLLVDAVFKCDYTLVQGIVFVYAILVIFMNLLVDLLYGYIDPRIKTE